MKTIFRYTNIALLTVAIFAAGAVATFAQDACADADGQTKLGDQFRAEFADKSEDGRKKAISTGKSFLEKYGACESAKDLSEYLKGQIPKMDAALAKMIADRIRGERIARFDGALKTKNWDDVYASGKELLANYEDLRTVEIVLASVGGEEAFKANFKYGDDAIRYAKMSITDLDAGKPFQVAGAEKLGLASAKDGYNFAYPNRPDAVGWMNLYIGYITQVGKKDKAGAAPFLYKATQSASEAAKNPVSFELIGAYYFEELNKVVEKIQLAAKDQKDTDAPDVAQKKVDDIKALVAMSNGISERAMDAFSRAYTLGKDAAYKAKMKKNVADAYKVRFAKETGVDEWIATAVAKPFVNPTTPVAPISDPEPTATASTGTGVGAANGTGVGAANGTGIGASNGSGMGGAKPATTTTTTKPATTTTVVKPAATPAKTPATKVTKPEAVVKKPAAKKKVG